MFAGFGGFYPDGSCCRTHVNNQPVIVSNNPSYTPGGTGGNSAGDGSRGSSGSGGIGGSSGGAGGTTSTPASRGPDPRSPDSGGQWVNKVRDPIN
jgi:hypothetical protein